MLWLFVYSMIFDEFSPKFWKLWTEICLINAVVHNSHRWENLANLEVKFDIKRVFFFFFLDGLLSVFYKKTKRLGCNWCYLGSWIIFWLIETKILNLYLLELCFVCVMLPNLSLFCMCNVFMYIYIVSLPLSNSKNLQLKPTFSKEQNPNPR